MSKIIYGLFATLVLLSSIVSMNHVTMASKGDSIITPFTPPMVTSDGIELVKTQFDNIMVAKYVPPDMIGKNYVVPTFTKGNGKGNFGVTQDINPLASANTQVTNPLASVGTIYNTWWAGKMVIATDNKINGTITPQYTRITSDMYMMPYDGLGDVPGIWEGLGYSTSVTAGLSANSTELGATTDYSFFFQGNGSTYFVDYPSISAYQHAFVDISYVPGDYYARIYLKNVSTDVETELWLHPINSSINGYATFMFQDVDPSQYGYSDYSEDNPFDEFHNCRIWYKVSGNSTQYMQHLGDTAYTDVDMYTDTSWTTRVVTTDDVDEYGLDYNDNFHLYSYQ